MRAECDLASGDTRGGREGLSPVWSQDSMSELQETAEGPRQSGRTEAPRTQIVEGHRANIAAWHILVVDDDAGSRELGEDILSAAGYRVRQGSHV